MQFYHWISFVFTIRNIPQHVNKDRVMMILGSKVFYVGRSTNYKNNIKMYINK